jgi:penicillin amidase
MAELQLDQLSLPWREMRESVLAVQVDRPEGKLAKDLLESWDGIVSADSPEAAVYQYFITEMAHKIVSNIAPDAIEYGMGKGFHPMIPRAFFGISWLSKLSDQIQHKPEGVLRGSWDDEIADALMRAVMKLKEGFGSTPKSWAWGQTRPLTLLHPFGNRPPMDKIFNLGPFPWGGDTQTVSQAGRMLTDLTANPPAIANLRMAVDVGNWENNYFVLAGGQSGNPLSPHYADMLELWKRGEGIPIAWSQESIQRISVSDLRLIDQGSNP